MRVKRYIEQLLEDIRDAHRSPDDDQVTDYHLEESQDMEEHFREVERYLSYDEEMEPPFHTFCGLQKEYFPKVEDLTVDELKALVSALNEMYFSWHITAEFPENLSNELKYTLLVKMLDESIMVMKDGMVHWSFCEYNTRTCIYGDQCKCLEEERVIKEEVRFARNWARQMKGTLQKEFINEYDKITLEIDEEAHYSGPMFEFISNGFPGVPEFAYEIEDHLEEIFERLAYLLRDHAELYELFSSLYFWKKYRALHVLLHMEVQHYKWSFFKIEPFYVEDMEIFKGYPRLKTTDEIIKELEEFEDLEDEEDEDLPF